MSLFLNMRNATEKRQEQFLWAARRLNQKEKVHTEFFLIFFAKISISTSSLCECKMNVNAEYVKQKEKNNNIPA